MTTEEMAAGLNLKLCTGITPTGHYCQRDHHVGSVAGDTVHFASREMTRTETLALFRLASHVLAPDLMDDPPWRRVYRQNVLFREMASRLGIRNPNHPASTDKRFVLAGVAGMSNSVPLRKQAFDWARRQGGKRL